MSEHHGFFQETKPSRLRILLCSFLFGGFLSFSFLKSTLKENQHGFIRKATRIHLHHLLLKHGLSFECQWHWIRNHGQNTGGYPHSNLCSGSLQVWLNMSWIWTTKFGQISYSSNLCCVKLVQDYMAPPFVAQQMGSKCMPKTGYLLAITILLKKTYTHTELKNQAESMILQV